MILRLCSDVHLEFWGADAFFDGIHKDELFENLLVPFNRDNETYLILAGDICLSKEPHRIKRFLEHCSKRFEKVLYIPGNHEFYMDEWDSSIKTIKSITSNFKNVHFDKTFTFKDTKENVSFILATLWTDFNKRNPISMLTAHEMMNDYKQIRIGKELLTPEHVLCEYEIHKDFIVNSLKRNNDLKMESIVITHHAPSELSCKEGYSFETNGSYCSSLESIILDYNPIYWLHGHVHHTNNYTIGDTTIISNPYGYPFEDEIKKDYYANLIIEI